METAPVHVPVLLRETLALLDPQPGGVYVDCTVGLGGHAAAILEHMEGRGLLLGIDRDALALAEAGAALAPFRPQVILVRSDFGRLREILERLALTAVDGILFDLGVSSLQLEAPGRGFSYWRDEPLDMRMDLTQPVSARHLVNGLTEAELAGLIREYGEERWAARIARFIVEARRRQPIETTGQLVEIVKEAVPAPARRTGGHPARRTFQALRIAVNRELELLEAALAQAVEALRPGGRVAVISFHSLEDRLVKQTFRRLAAACVCPPEAPTCTCRATPLVRVLTPQPVVPQPEEVGVNPRARSARLRAAERLRPDLRVLRGGRGE